MYKIQIGNKKHFYIVMDNLYFGMEEKGLKL